MGLGKRLLNYYNTACAQLEYYGMEHDYAY
jgi:hypothetical protein